MSNRGRPKTPDVLTPREYEVLALLRDGLSNREVAERLGISLAGAKYHVSEIIGKLGVESREQAAAWRETVSRRWGFAPLSVLSSWGEGVVAFVTPKVAVPALAVVIVAGIGAGMVAFSGGKSGEGRASPLGASEPTPTPEMMPICEQVECAFMREIRTEVVSLEEAATLATFQLRLPAYIPEGFDERTMTHAKPGPMTTILSDGTREEHPYTSSPYSDKVWAMYRNVEGNYLAVEQAYNGVAPTSWYDIAPADMKGTLELHGKEMRWIKGGPKPTTQWELNEYGGARPVAPGWEEGGFKLYWTMGAVELDAWEITPDGGRNNASMPFEFVVSSDSLPLEELLKVAESVMQ